MILHLYSVNEVKNIDSFLFIIKQSCIPGIKPKIMYYLFNILLDLIATILLRICCIYFLERYWFVWVGFFSL